MLDTLTPFSSAEALPSGLWSRAQTTLARPFEQVGIGLHTGAETTVRVYPAPIHAGRYFVRIDLPDHPPIPAQISAVQQTQLSTELVAGSAHIRTVEHLLAALAGMGIDNVRIEVNGPELPLLDGSAQGWVEAIAIAGLEFQDADRQPTPLITQPIWVTQGDAFVAALPSSLLRFTYGIEFREVAIGKQWHSWALMDNSFATDIAPARTFGLAAQIEALRSQGLIQGGSLENALVCDGEGWINPPLRFENEPVRHKLLDLLGDLSLLGQIPQAHFLAYKASHQLHTQLAAAILTQAFTNAD